MTESLKELIQQEAEKHKGDFECNCSPAYIAGATSMVEKMEGFSEWVTDSAERLDNRESGNARWIDREGDEYTTSELLSIYFEQLKKKEV